MTGFVRRQLTFLQTSYTSYSTTQFSGFTLTATDLYLSVQVHRSTRIQQRDAIREQAAILNDISSPLGAYYRSFAQEEETPRKDSIAATSKKPSAEELLKHQWNKELETLAKKALNLRWQDVSHTATESFKTISKFVKRE
jgi:altered-inheritance-of-mitochondria protein 5